MEKIWVISIECFFDNKRNLQISEMTLEEALMIAKANNFTNLKWTNNVAEEISKTHSCRILKMID
jgi:hypothetical protein